MDPVIDHLKDYLAELGRRQLTLTHVIDTHTHADHISAGSSLRDMTGCAYVMHDNAPAKCVTHHVKDGDKLQVGSLTFDVLYTPGHTKDSISLVVDGKFLTGDFLFLDDAGGGRDDLPGGDAGEHWESLSKAYDLPDTLLVCPSHDYRNREPSSFGRQKDQNPHYKARTKAEFIDYLSDLKLGPADWMADVLKANYTCAKNPTAAWIPVDAPACEIKGTLEPGVNETPVTPITAQELKALLDRSRPPILLDVREPSELASELGAIPGVLNIPIGALAGALPSLEKFKEDNLFVVCRSGGRAATGAQILTRAGFGKARILEGGMLAWRKAGY